MQARRRLMPSPSCQPGHDRGSASDKQYLRSDWERGRKGREETKHTNPRIPNAPRKPWPTAWRKYWVRILALQDLQGPLGLLGVSAMRVGHEPLQLPDALHDLRQLDRRVVRNHARGLAAVVRRHLHVANAELGPTRPCGATNKYRRQRGGGGDTRRLPRGWGLTKTVTAPLAPRCV